MLIIGASAPEVACAEEAFMAMLVILGLPDRVVAEIRPSACDSSSSGLRVAPP